MSVEQPENKAAIRDIFLKALETQSPSERQALATMDHPNIAKVFDAGMTDAVVAAGILPASKPGFQPGGESLEVNKTDVDANARPGGRMPPSLAGKMPAPLSAGRPYFVMELVRGIKITDYCDEKKLSTGERLDLFIKVCQAVQHAHQKGIIHRDLKPSNILVTVNDGVAVPKIIDFGIAKATQAELTEKTVFTRFHQFLGTPAYMSPEQVEMTSLDIDTRSDIYSLGVLLYETANGLASDIQRHLNNEPVVACPPSNLYRFQKLVRRNKLAFAASAGIAVALLIGLAVALWQSIEKTRAYNRAAAAEKAAQSEAAKSRQVAQYLKGLLEDLGPSVALVHDPAMVRAILDRAAERVDQDLGNRPETAI